MCQNVLAAVKDVFFSRPDQHFSHYPVAGMQTATQDASGQLIWADVETSDFSQLYLVRGAEILLSGSHINLATYRHPGCGGACERFQLLAWKGEPKLDAVVRDDAVLSSAPPAATVHNLHRSQDGKVYLISDIAPWQGTREVLVHQLHADATWTQVCRIAKEPDTQTLIPELQALHASVMGVLKGAGDCGSMRTHDRWISELNDGINRALYQPWVLIEALGAPHANGYDGSYESDQKGLRDWGLMNIEDRLAADSLKLAVAAAKPALASFYRERFGWKPADAEWAAAGVAEGIASIAVRFYQYQPLATSVERELREAILLRRPLTEIQQLSLPKEGMQGFGGPRPDPYWDAAHGETVLNVAVEYPEALAWLLEEGANPNWPNNFGKTPLMYAAQRNAIDSVRLLLAAGADVNARTRLPQDNCYYTLNTTGMTPLHYAVRYASQDVVEALLDAGAQNFIRTRQYDGSSPTTPMDWFGRFRMGTDFDAGLQARLLPDSLQARAEKARRWRLEAEASYGRGEIKLAAERLKLAAEAAPDDVRVLSALSLVAFRDEEPGVAAIAARQVLASAAESKVKADAWFNYGLICEAQAKATKRASFYYDGSYQCVEGLLYPFLQSLALADSGPRRNKIESLFQQGALTSCLSQYHGELVQVHVSSAPGSKRILVAIAHPPSVGIKSSDFGEVMPDTVDSVSQYELGERRLTVFFRDGYARFPFRVGQSRCAKSGQE